MEYLFLLSSVSVAFWQVLLRVPAPTIKEKMTMIAMQTKPHGLVPPMDRSAPARTQTATFALG